MGLKEAIEEGLAEGREKGIIEGRAEGITHARQEMAEKLLAKGMSVDDIAT